MINPRLVELERKTILVQFIGVEPLAFYSTADGTDLIQDILRSQLSRSDQDIIGQEGSLSIDEQGEFLRFEPTDRTNRTLHLPIEHLAYSGALRRMRQHSSDQRKSDQIYQRDFENVDLANRYPHHIIGPPIFVAIFHGFDRALTYTFLTQSADDACLFVMKLMRAFRAFEQRLIEEQQQIEEEQQRQQPFNHSNRNSNPNVIHPPSIVSSPTIIGQSMPTNVLLSPPPPPSITPIHSIVNQYDDQLIEKILLNPNYELVDSTGCSTTQIIYQQPIICCQPTETICQCSSCISLSPCSSLSTVHYIIDPSNSHCYQI